MIRIVIDRKEWDIWEVYVLGYFERFDEKGTSRMGMRAERLYGVVVEESSELSYSGEGVCVSRISSDQVGIGCCLEE